MNCRFEEFLTNYQDDLCRIVGKHLNHGHKLTVGDVVSTVNYQLIKTKQKFFDRFGYNFKKSDFGRWAYSYAINSTKWGVSKSLEDNKQLSDGIFQTSDGEKTLYEIVCEGTGEEDESFEEFDGDGKIKVVENIINKYSHILTPVEKHVFASLLRGKSEGAMATEQGVTRQAINITRHNVTNKIRAYYKLSVEDAPNISAEDMDSYIEVVLAIFNKDEERRIKFQKKGRKTLANSNPYIYALD
jgi:hypothetical protein